MNFTPAILRSRFLRVASGLCACALGLAAASAAPLRTARQVRALSAEQARAAPEAVLEGIVLAVIDAHGAAFVLQDATDPLYVSGEPDQVVKLAAGDRVRVTGRADPGGYAPIVRAQTIEPTGRAELPPPTRVAPQELFSQGLDARWLTVTGIVHSIRDTGPDVVHPARLGDPQSRRLELSLAIGDRLMPVLFYGRLDRDALLDAEVELDGLCFSQHNVERQFLNPSLFVARAEDIRIVKPAPHGPFDGPAVSARSLFTFKPEGISLHRVRVDGIVLHQVPGRGLWLRDGDTGLFVQAEGTLHLVPGDRVQVAGYPQRGRFSPILIDAIYHRPGPGEEPPPRRLDDPALLRLHDGDLVTIVGTLTARKENSEGTVYGLDCGGREIAAVFPPDAGAPPPALEVGSVVSAAGICLAGASPVETPVSGVLVPSSFSLLVRRASDLAVVRAAPWWNDERIARALWAAVAVLAVVLAAVFLGSRRRFARAQAHRAREAAESAARLAERSRMARELHDTLAQGLGAISLQLQLAANGPGDASARDSHLALANQLLRSSMQEVRSFIRNLRTQTRQDVDLGPALQELLATAVEGTPIRATFRTEGTPRKFPVAIQAQVIRIVQEAVANAVRHARADTLTVTLRYLGQSLVATVVDNGVGFDPEAAPAGLHFGLLGMKERAALIGATLVITAKPGQGTRIELTAPENAVVRDSLSL